MEIEGNKEKALPRRVYWELETLYWAKWPFAILGVVAWLKGVPVLPWVLFGTSVAIIGRRVNQSVRWGAFARPLNPRKLPGLIRAAQRLQFRVVLLLAGGIAAVCVLLPWLGWGRWVEGAVFFSCLVFHGCLRNYRTLRLFRSWMANPSVPLTVRTRGVLYQMGGEAFREVYVSSPREEVALVRIANSDFYRELFPEDPDGGGKSISVP